MKKHAFQKSGLAYLACSITLTALTLVLPGCDPGKLSTCVFRDTNNCTPATFPPDAGEDLQSSGEVPPHINTAIKFDKHFEFIMTSGYQFAGILKNESILLQGKEKLIKITKYLAGGPIPFTTQDADLGIRIDNWFQEQRDKVYFAGGFLFFVQHDPDLTRLYSADGNILWTYSNKFRGPSVRSFFDQHTLSYAVEANLTPSGTLVQLQLAGKSLIHRTDTPLSAYLIGNLDDIDNNSNGLEFIAFSQTRVNILGHQSSATSGVINADHELATSLQAAITSRASSLPVTAACIVNINNDKYQEILYAVGGTVHAITYRGREWIKSGHGFYHWPPESLINIPNKIISSISVININGDEYPDLVIETKDSGIYYFLNLPQS